MLRRRRSNVTWDRDASILLDYFKSVPSPASNSYARQINKIMKIRKGLGEHERDYVFYHFAAETEAQACANWKNPGTFTLTKAGTVAFSANRGFTPSGAVADGLQTGWNINNTSTDDVAVEIYSRTDQAAGARYDWGGSSAVLGRTRISGDLCNFRLNMSAAVSLPSSVTTTLGLQSWLRGAANTAQFCQNGVQVGGDVTVSSQAPPSVNFVFGNSLIGTNSSTTRELAFGRVSRVMTVAKCLQHWQNAIQPLLKWNGAA